MEKPVIVLRIAFLLTALADFLLAGWLYALWPPATTPQQDVIWTTGFAILGLAAVLAFVYFTSPKHPNNGRTH